MVERDQLAKSDIFHLSTSNDSIALSLFSDWVSKKKLFVCVETFLEMSFQPHPLFLNIRTMTLDLIELKLKQKSTFSTVNF